MMIPGSYVFHKDGRLKEAERASKQVCSHEAMLVAVHVTIEQHIFLFLFQFHSFTFMEHDSVAEKGGECLHTCLS